MALCACTRGGLGALRVTANTTIAQKAIISISGNSMDTALYGGKVIVNFKEDGHVYTVSIDGGKFTRKTGVTTACGVLDKSGALIPWAVGVAVDYIKEHRDLLDTDDASDIYAKAEEESDKKKNEAADLGTLIHAWVEADVKGLAQEMPTDERVVRGAIAWMEWKQSHNATIVHSETPVFSLKYDFVGTLDFIADIVSCGGKCCGETKKGKKLHVLGDVKTGNGIYESHGMQTAGYLLARQEETKEKFDGRLIVRLSKESEEEHTARIAEKNAKREKQGKKTMNPKFFVVETVWLDAKEGLKEDTKAFINALALYKWQYPAKKRLDLAKDI